MKCRPSKSNSKKGDKKSTTSKSEPKLLYINDSRQRAGNKCTYSAQYVSPRIACRQQANSAPHSHCNAVPLYNTPRNTNVQCIPPAHVNNSQCACKDLPPLGPPCATKDDLWNLQFCRWWGWNWIRKREEEMMNKQKDLTKSNKKRSCKSSRSKSRKRQKSRKKDNFMARCRKFCRRDCNKELTSVEKNRLNKLYDTPCPSIMFPCNVNDQSLHFEGEYECNYSSSRQTCPTVIQPCKTRRQRCKCNRREHQSWLCEESSSSDECCHYVSACPRRPCGSTTEESIAYLSLRMDRLKSDCGENLGCTCQGKSCAKLPCHSSQPKLNCNCDPQWRKSRPSPCTKTPHCRKQSPCRPRYPPPPRIPVLRRCPPCSYPQPYLCKYVHACPKPMPTSCPKYVKQPKCCCSYQNRVRQQKCCCCQNIEDYAVCCACQRPQVKKGKIKHYTVCCPCQQQCKVRLRCDNLKEIEDTPSQCDSTQNGEVQKRKLEGVCEKTLEKDKTSPKNSSLGRNLNTFVETQQKSYDTGFQGDYFQNNSAYKATQNNVSMALETGAYTSPASGKMYTLNPKIFTAKPIPNQSAWPNPVNYKEEAFAFNVNPIRLLKTDEEHKLLLTAVCEAIMSSRTSRMSEASDITFQSCYEPSLGKPPGDNDYSPGSQDYYESFNTGCGQGFSHENSYNTITDTYYDRKSPVCRYESPQPSAVFSSFAPESSHDKQIAKYHQQKPNALNWQNYAGQNHNNRDSYSCNAPLLEEKFISSPTNMRRTRTNSARNTYRHAPLSLEKFNNEPVCFLDYTSQKSYREELTTEPVCTALTKPTSTSLLKPISVSNLFSAVTKAMSFKPQEVAEKSRYGQQIYNKSNFGSRSENNVARFKNECLYNVLYSTVNPEPGKDSNDDSHNFRPAQPSQHSSLPLQEHEQASQSTTTKRLPACTEDLEKELRCLNLGAKRVCPDFQLPSTSKENGRAVAPKSTLPDNVDEDDLEDELQCVNLMKSHVACSNSLGATSKEIGVHDAPANKMKYYHSDNKLHYFTSNREDEFHPYRKPKLTANKIPISQSRSAMDEQLQEKIENESSRNKLQYSSPNENVKETSYVPNQNNSNYETTEKELLCLDLNKNFQLFPTATPFPSYYDNLKGSTEHNLHSCSAPVSAFNYKLSENVLTVVNRGSEECLNDLHFISKNLPSYSSISDTSSIASALKRGIITKKSEVTQTVPFFQETQPLTPKIMVNTCTSPFSISLQETPKLYSRTSPFKFDYIKSREEDKLAADNYRRKIMKRESPFSMFCVPVTSKNIVGMPPQDSAALSRPERKLIVGKTKKLQERDKRWRY